MWDDIRAETGGRVDTRVFAQNNNEWKEQLGSKCWSLLEAETGALG
jgi:hypothetical protein